MEKISVFNYEVFYLDYLEGNLSENDTSLLFAFLEQHPELKMDDKELPILQINEVKFSNKESLKQPLFSDEITPENIEYFLIANAERLLSPQEHEKLNTFIAKNPIYKKEQEIFASVYFKTDESIIYTHKENLKKKKVIVLWPYISIAASLLLAFLIWNSSQSSKIEVPQQQVAEKPIETPPLENSEEIKEDNFKVLPQESVLEKTKRPIIAHSPKKELKQEINDSPVQKTDDLPIKNSPVIENNTPPQTLVSSNHKKLEPVTPKTIYNTDNAPISSAIVEDNMINPIEPITAFLKKKTNTVIEYKKQDRTETQPKKVFIKIGRFEFYRKKK